MNEFVEQFLIEGRELVAQGNDDLLALEERPDDRERLDSAFRAFHTLKGAAGIVDFVAMGRALHAAEDVLVGRAVGQRAGDAAADRSVPGLPRPGQRLDRPDAGRAATFPADADAEADDLVRRFAELAASDTHPRSAAARSR